MSAGTPDPVQAGRSNRPGRAGYTRISTGTLQRLMAAVAAEAFEVPLRDVRAGLTDAKGQLRASLALPLALEGRPGTRVGGTFAGSGGTVFDRAAGARSTVGERFHQLAGSVVDRVDVRFTGLHQKSQTKLGRVT